jgi:glycosyltransferase involved in cell wall biosynthesis
MRIVYVYADSAEEWNCSEWRCAVPQRAINRSKRHFASLISLNDFAYNAPAAREVCDWADAIIVQRTLFGPVLSAIQHWKARDKVIIADFDDAYDLIPPSNPAHAFWLKGLKPVGDASGKKIKISPTPLTQFKLGLRLVHAATVPSKRLADDWRDYTHVHYLPNYIDLEKYQNIATEPHDGIIIGWGGSTSHLESFTESGVLSALRRVCRARPKVKVMLCGNDARIAKQLQLPAEQLILRPWVPYAQWATFLADFDIGLAPLYGSYDERRSWIKVLEYMVMKIPWIASQGPAYDELSHYGWLVQNTPSTWERVLLDMIDHLPDHKIEAAQDPYLFAISQSIDENVGKVVNVYASIAEHAMNHLI